MITTALFLTAFFIATSVCAAGVSYLPDVTAEMSKPSYWTENDALLITREQLASVLYRYAQYKGYGTTVGESTNILSYTDAENIPEYAISAMQYAVGSGLMKGKTETTINPADNATRAEVAAILKRFLKASK